MRGEGKEMRSNGIRKEDCQEEREKDMMGREVDKGRNKRKIKKEIFINKCH